MSTWRALVLGPEDTVLADMAIPEMLPYIEMAVLERITWQAEPIDPMVYMEPRRVRAYPDRAETLAQQLANNNDGLLVYRVEGYLS